MATEDLTHWARTADFPQPIRWGEVEARILTEPAPAREDLVSATPAHGALTRSVLAVPAALLAVVVFGSSVLGLVVVSAYALGGSALPSGWDPVLQGLFVVAVVMAVFPVLVWSSTRRRSPGMLALAGATAAASAVSVLMVGSADRTGVWSSLQLLAAVAAVAGVVSVVFLLVVAKPGPRRPRPGRRGKVEPEEQWMRGQRALVLEQLRKRDLVSDADASSILELPRGAWQQLESLPDGRVVHR